jgi:hypothetical protein
LDKEINKEMNSHYSRIFDLLTEEENPAQDIEDYESQIKDLETTIGSMGESPQDKLTRAKLQRELKLLLKELEAEKRKKGIAGLTRTKRAITGGGTTEIGIGAKFAQDLVGPDGKPIVSNVLQ